MSTSESKPHAADAVGVNIHTRDGFSGDMCSTLRPNSVHEFARVVGPHAPHRFGLCSMPLRDRADASELPIKLLGGRAGLSVSASGLAAPAPYAWRNVECDEVHFVQEGVLDIVTSFGTLRAEPGDFVYIGRAVGYRLEPVDSPTTRLIIEVPERVRIATSLPFGVLDPGQKVVRPDAAKTSARSGPGELWLRSFDGITKYSTPGDPLALTQILGGEPPVWKVNLTSIAQQTTSIRMSPPAQFAGTASRNALFFNLSARANDRPPHHVNADYDELIFYFRGPTAYGAIDAPGTLTWCPKGTVHWGAEEDVAGEYFAWLLECNDTLRLSPEGKDVASLMETGLFGLHPTSAT